MISATGHPGHKELSMHDMSRAEVDGVLERGDKYLQQNIRDLGLEGKRDAGSLTKWGDWQDRIGKQDLKKWQWEHCTRTHDWRQQHLV